MADYARVHSQFAAIDCNYRLLVECVDGPSTDAATSLIAVYKALGAGWAVTRP